MSELRFEKVEAGKMSSQSLRTDVGDDDTTLPVIRLSAWPVRVGKAGGWDWKSFKAARGMPLNLKPLRERTK